MTENVSGKLGTAWKLSISNDKLRKENECLKAKIRSYEHMYQYPFGIEDKARLDKLKRKNKKLKEKIKKLKSKYIKETQYPKLGYEIDPEGKYVAVFQYDTFSGKKAYLVFGNTGWCLRHENELLPISKSIGSFTLKQINDDPNILAHSHYYDLEPGMKSTIETAVGKFLVKVEDDD